MVNDNGWRLALIFARPKLLLVDEPAAGLTDHETELTAQLLTELRGDHTLIVIEHDMDFVRALDARVTVLDSGKILADGSLDEIQQMNALLKRIWVVRGLKRGNRVLVLDQISYAYGAVQALKNVSMRFEPGRFPVLLAEMGWVRQL